MAKPKPKSIQAFPIPPSRPPSFNSNVPRNFPVPSHTYQVKQPSMPGQPKSYKTVTQQQYFRQAGVLQGPQSFRMLSLGAMGMIQNVPIVSAQVNYQVLYEFEKASRSSMKEVFTESKLLQLLHARFGELLRQKITNYILAPQGPVPRDSGRLRLALVSSLQGNMSGSGGGSYSNFYSLNPFRLVLGTPNVEYAQVVNNMPNEWLIHPGWHGRVTSKRTGREVRAAHILYDPGAKSHWFENVVLVGRTYAEDLWDTFINTALIPFLQSCGIDSAYAPTPLSILANALWLEVKLG